jgi:hypothetical protein
MSDEAELASERQVFDKGADVDAYERRVADVSLPTAVVNFAQGGEHASAHVAIHRQNARHVLDDEHAMVADLAQQAAGRELREFALAALRGRQQRPFGRDRAGDVRAGAGQRLHGFGFGVAGPGNDQQPERIAGQLIGSRRGRGRVDDDVSPASVSTALMNVTPSTCWTRSTTSPPLPQPRQCQTCFRVLTLKRS